MPSLSALPVLSHAVSASGDSYVVRVLEVDLSGVPPTLPAVAVLTRNSGSTVSNGFVLA